MAAALIMLAVGVTDWWKDRDPSPGTADVGFYDDMTVHHFQAIDMARRYMRNGEDSHLLSIAGEIDFTQSGDIRVMQLALESWDEPGTPDTAMEWMGEGVDPAAMPGLATPDELDALDSTRGRELDDLFTRLMIDHHAGGAAMADVAAADARLPGVRRLADSMAFTQRREIDEMNHRRSDLGLAVYDAPIAGHERH